MVFISLLRSPVRAFQPGFQPVLTKSKATTLNMVGVADVSIISTAIDAWSVNGANLNSPDIASAFFAISLVPYLTMLYYLTKKETKTPQVSLFGFYFLLVFVFATIPAGIYAKYQYHDILANIDWLHGLAESLLTVTNLLIITGFRQTLRGNQSGNKTPSSYFPPSSATTGNDLAEYHAKSSTSLNDLGAIVLLVSLVSVSLSGFFPAPHIEPVNALSLPTWMVHTSSILEWLIAMKLIWEHSFTANNPRWKGMTIAMIPSHVSGMCACTFHFFYNNPSLYWDVNLQAVLTTVGNTCMALAAFRIFDFEKNRSDETVSQTSKSDAITVVTLPTPIKPLPESDTAFAAQLFVKSLAVAFIVKYGELFLDFPFDASNEAALAALSISPLYNCFKWAWRSSIEDTYSGSKRENDVISVP